MGRLQTGYTYQDKKGRWYCRYDYKAEDGKWRVVRRRAESKGKARELLDKLLRDYKERGQRAIDGDRMTFNDLAAYYQDTYSDGSAWERASDPRNRVVRGGSILYGGGTSHSASRWKYTTDHTDNNLGFRVALSAPSR